MKISICRCQVVHKEMDSNRHRNSVRLWISNGVTNNILVIVNMDDGEGLKK